LQLQLLEAVLPFPLVAAAYADDRVMVRVCWGHFLMLLYSLCHDVFFFGARPFPILSLRLFAKLSMSAAHWVLLFASFVMVLFYLRALVGVGLPRQEERMLVMLRFSMIMVHLYFLFFRCAIF
jgi:hypothetical protein